MPHLGLRHHWIETYVKLVARGALAANTRAVNTSTQVLRVLLYHKVNETAANPLSVSPARFETHLRVIVGSKWTPVTLRQVEAWTAGAGSLPAHPLLLTFDDGYRDNFTNAAPLLRRYGVPACCFITVGVMDSRGLLPHDLRYGVAHDKAELMTWDEARELESQGWDFGSHGMSHIQADQLTEEAFEEELQVSLQRMRDELRDPVTAYCYPRGVYGDRHVAMVKAAGYTLAFTTQAGTNDSASDAFQLKRTMIETLDGKLMLRAALAGRLDRYWIKEFLPVRVAKSLMKRIAYA